MPFLDFVTHLCTVKFRPASIKQRPGVPFLLCFI